MSTQHIEDISHKRFVPTKYMPNTYRIFCEEISNDSVAKDQSQVPPPSLYNQPMIVPAQAIEDRNHPQGGRHATFLRENAKTLNEPVAKIASTNSRDAERRWWEWNATTTATGDDFNKVRSKRRSQSNAPPSSSSSASSNGSADLQTTYQKDHGYLKELSSGANSNVAIPTRHGANPNIGASPIVGIVPVNDLNGFTKPGEEQRVFVDKMSFDHQYDSRQANNYPIMGRRHGAFVLDQVNPAAPPRPVYGHKTHTDASSGASIWELMQPLSKPRSSQAASAASPPDSRSRRRDPIGYFSDSKYGDEYNADKKQQQAALYEPSWMNNANGTSHEHIHVNGGANGN